MAYVVLARKYRPLAFADMVGQDHITRTLTHAIRQGRVHHAYLLCGARGLGKTTAARILAKALVCEQGPTAEPCNRCHQCVAVNESRSVDVMEIDGASNNSVDDVRSLRDQVAYLPQSARRKIYIIDEVHMLSTSAFNALLKTLEEPPPHVGFILATTEPQKLPATILSRVSRLEVRRLSTERMAEHLRDILQREGAAVDEPGLRLVARSSGGSVRDALTLLDQVLSFADDLTHVTEEHVRAVLGQADRSAVADLVDAMLAGTSAATLTRLDELLGAGHDVMVLGIQVLEQLRDLLVVKLCPGREVLVDATSSELERLRESAALVDETRLGQAFDRMARTIDLLPSSRAARLVLEVGVLSIAHAEPLVPISETISRLQALARPASTRPKSEPTATRRPDPSPPPESPRPSPAPPAKGRGPAGIAPPTGGPADPSASLSQSLWNLARERGVVDDAAAAEPAAASDEEPPPVAAPERAPTGPPGLPAFTPIAWEQLSPFDTWEQLVQRIRAEDDYLGAVLCEVGLVGLEPGRLRLCADDRSFAGRELSGRGELRAALEQALRSHLAAVFELEIQAAEPALPERPSVSLTEAKRRRELEAQIAAEAREHPAILRLMEAFDARIGQVKPVV